jgi:1,4-dihydroxy-6-naphthoate synthase
MTLNLGFSPCPNDTFIFDALVNGKIDCDGMHFNPHLADVEELNNLTSQNKLEISKISIAAYPAISNHYQLLTCGGAIGSNNGPLLICKKPFDISDIYNKKIAIPGFRTTANLLFSIAFPQARNKAELLFSKIEDAVLSGDFDAGLIIHESRFTYQKKGLIKVLDMGEYWDTTYHQLIPLGGIAIRRNLPEDIKLKINTLIANSVRYAFANPQSSQKYIKNYAQELDDSVIEQHIKLYVNDYSFELGDEGKDAIKFLFEKGDEYGLLEKVTNDIFIGGIK